jgi:hypothetical protein
MDQTLLVTGSEEDGRKLIDRLAAAGLDVTAAGWAKTYHDGRYHLYVAVRPGGDGRDAWSGAVRGALDADDIGIDPASVKVIRADESLAHGLAMHPRRFAGRPGLWVPADRLPPVGFDGPAYVYAPIPTPAPAGS